MTATPPSHNLSVPLILSLCGAIMASCGHRPPPLRTNTPTAHPQSAASTLAGEAKSEPNPDPQTTTLAEPNYGNALVVRARDFPDGLSGTIMCEGFVIPAGELIILGDDLVVESSGPIIINGDLIGGAPWDGLDGVNIVLESTEFIRITGLVQPGDGMNAAGVRVVGGAGGDLRINAPLIETTQESLRAGDGGNGGHAGTGGRGGAVRLSGGAAMFEGVEPWNIVEDANVQIIGGNAGDGGTGIPGPSLELYRGGGGGEGGAAIAGEFEMSEWMHDIIVARTGGGTPGTNGLDDIAPLTPGRDGADSLAPCKPGKKALPGIPALGGSGGAGGPGCNAVPPQMMVPGSAAGVGGNGGRGGLALGGKGGVGGRGGDCCGPRPLTFGKGGAGGRGGNGGAGTGGPGGDGGKGGNGAFGVPNGAHGGSGGNSGMGRGGSADNGGAGGHGNPGGTGGQDASAGTGQSLPWGSGGDGGDAAPGGMDGSDGSPGISGGALTGQPSIDGASGLDCDVAYLATGGSADPNNPSGNNAP